MSATFDAETPIVICLLGKFRVLKDGEELPVREGSKVQALLGRLALSPTGGLHREILMSAIWPESDAPAAGQSLNSLVYSLRRMLSDGIGGAAPVIQDRGYYWLNFRAGICVDLARFEDLSAQGDRWWAAGNVDGAMAAYARAVAFYCGDLADDGDIGSVIERERYRSKYLSVLACLADNSFLRSDYDGCIERAQALLARDPCREDAHRLVMRCQVRLGRRAQALRQFRVCEEILRASFDAIPEPITLTLFDQIRLDPATV
jgi:DNA-binding SARP family transcriptional activator